MDAVDAAKDYLGGNKSGTPFLVPFDSAADLCALEKELASCETVRMSDACATADVKPNLDVLMDSLANKTGKVLLLGLGEYAGLTGDWDFVRRIFGFRESQARIVVPLWKGHFFFEKAAKDDPRVIERRGCSFPERHTHWRATVFCRDLAPKKVDARGFKDLLHLVEDGCNGSVTAVTSVVPLETEWCRLVNSAYEIYRDRHPQSMVPESMFSDKQWEKFIGDNCTEDDDIVSAGALLHHLEVKPEDPYLAYVVSKTESFGDWKRNLLTAILDIKPDDDRFPTFYESRKKIIKNLPHEDIADFLHETQIVAEDVRVDYLTDSTAMERDAIVALVAKLQEMPKAVRWVYPALWNYWAKFSFSSNGELDAILSEYFQEYKKQKLFGRVEPQFDEKVRSLAETRPQFGLQTRESILEGVRMRAPGTKLCWVDALGCEFLGFIQSAAEQQGLKIKVTPARAKLPSITSVNRGFYDEWQGEKMEKNERLDKIKHGEFNRANLEWAPTPNAPAELPYELDVLDETLRLIATDLRKKHGSKVVLTSDHGATRLAILSERETVWEMPEKGKHGGRCCRKNEISDSELPPCVTKSEDEKWHVLAGYDRFRGGRMGDVEVHGGATLEEMVVPVIEFELLKDNIRIKLEQDKFKVTFRDSEIVLKFFCSEELSAPSVEISGNRHPAECESGKRIYTIRVQKPEAGDYVANVYDGDTKVGAVRFSVVSGGAQIKNDFF